MAKYKPAGRRQTIPFASEPFDLFNAPGEMGTYAAPINHPLFKRFPLDEQPIISNTPLSLNTGRCPLFYEPSLRIGKLRRLLND